MKNLIFKSDNDKEFACLWEGFIAVQRIPSHKLRMFNRIVDKLESISTGNPEAINEVAEMLSTKRGRTLIGVWVVNRQLNISEKVILELEDEDFNYLKERIAEVSWNPGAAKAAEKLLSMLEEAEKK